MMNSEWKERHTYSKKWAIKSVIVLKKEQRYDSSPRSNLKEHRQLQPP